MTGHSSVDTTIVSCPIAAGTPASEAAAWIGEVRRGDVIFARVSPDQKHIYFVSNRGFKEGIWRIPFPVSELGQVSMPSVTR